MRGVLIFVFVLGLILGLLITANLSKDKTSITGKAADCFVNNEPCTCTEAECICGDNSFDVSVCKG